MPSESPRSPQLLAGSGGRPEAPIPHILALPSLTRSPFYFVCFPKEHPPDSLPGVIDAGGGGFSQPLAFALASPGGAVVAAVSGTPAGAVRACAGCAARSRARFCKQSGATSQSNNWGNVFCQFPPISQQASFISTCNEDEPIPEVSIKRPGAGTAGAAASLAPCSHPGRLQGQRETRAQCTISVHPRPRVQGPSVLAHAGPHQEGRGTAKLAPWSKPARTQNLFLGAALISTWWIKHISS